MKTISAIRLFLAAAAIIFTNCAPETIAPDSLAQEQTFRLSVYSPDTRTANSGMQTVWSSGDAINVLFGVPNSTYGSAGKATIAEGVGESRAVFTMPGGTVPGGALNWYVVYPYNSASSTPAKASVSIGGENITQNGYNSTAHLAGSLCPLYGTAGPVAISEVSVPVRQMSSVIEFNVNNNSGSAFTVKSVRLDATESIAGSFTADLIETPPTFTDVMPRKSSTVSISGGTSLPSGSTAKVYMPVKPYKHDTSKKFAVTVTLDVNGSTASVPFNIAVGSAKASFSAGRIKPVSLNVTSDMLFGSLEITSVEAKCHKAEVTGEAATVGTSVIQYRKSSSSSWQTASSTVSGSTVSATLTGLDDNTSYQVRVSAGSVSGAAESFTTMKEGAQLYNMNFDDWYTKNSVQYCYSSSATSAQKAIWASANENTYSLTNMNGAAGDSFVAVSGSGKKSLKLTSKYIYKNYVITKVDKLAAGSLFTGSLGDIDIWSQSATINMGVSFTDRPDALEGYACYKPKAIDHTDDSHVSMKGKTDSGHVFVLLTDWSGPFAVTPPNTLIDFNNDSHIIGYGKITFNSTMSGYQKFTIPIEYRNSRTPKYVVICGTSSALGDYFTGADGSILYLDEFKFIYE